MSEALVTPQEFKLDEYLHSHSSKVSLAMSGALDSISRFQILCNKVKEYLDEEWNKEENRNNQEVILERQKRAILGYPKEVNYYKDRIREYIKHNKLDNEYFPKWYSNLVDSIFNENWGIAGIEPWTKLSNSTSAKIIGERIYFMNPVTGKMELQPQKISKTRFEQLRRALIMSDRSKRLDDDYTEVYMYSGERVIIYTGKLVAHDLNTIVFRKYIVNALTFGEQANRGTIPRGLIPALEAMVSIGVRVAFIGPVRTGKSTMLTTFQMYEDRSLEGLFIQTDPEIRINEIMPDAPIMSFIAEGEEASNLSSKIVRSDADYVVVAEGRDGYAYNLIVEAANKGTIRNKTTLHLSDVEDFCYDIANKIITVYGGNLDYQIVKVAKSFDYLFEMVQLPENKNNKRLNSIYELRYDHDTHEISYHRICQYFRETDSWKFYYTLGDKVKSIGKFENPIALQILDNTLKKLAEDMPMDEKVLKPFYGKVSVNE